MLTRASLSIYTWCAVNDIEQYTRWAANKRQQRLMFRWITVTRQTDQQWCGKWVLSTDHRPPGVYFPQPTVCTSRTA